MTEDALWLVFIVIFMTMIVLDLGVVNRGDKQISTRRAVNMTVFFVAVALLFGFLIYTELGSEKAVTYCSTYVIELMMSVDNLFVFIIIFSMFSVRPENQHKVLFWGILGAVFFRAAFIFVGAALLNEFEFVMYIFGIILIYVAYKTVVGDDGGPKKDSIPVKLSRHIRASPEPDGDKFITVRDGIRMATPMLICLVVIELSDIMFALDSIPAALAITTDTFIVYSSNILAVMGLRSMYFALSGAMCSLSYLKYGLGVILGFIGVKMLLNDVVRISPAESLMFIMAVLIVTVATSYFIKPKYGAEKEL